MDAPALSLVFPFRGKSDVDYALELATQIAMRELRRNPKIPPLYEAGVRFARDKCKAPGVRGACEPFKSPLELMRLKGRKRVGDCDDLNPWRAAELRLGRGHDRVTGLQAKAFARRAPGIGFHVLVVRANGDIEDPSRVLGMDKDGR